MKTRATSHQSEPLRCSRFLFCRVFLAPNQSPFGRKTLYNSALLEFMRAARGEQWRRRLRSLSVHTNVSWWGLNFSLLDTIYIMETTSWLAEDSSSPEERINAIFGAVIALATSIATILLWVLAIIGEGLRLIPGPTDNWSTIIGHIIWPSTLIAFGVGFRRDIAGLFKVLRYRFWIAKDIKAFNGLIELTGEEQVIDYSHGEGDQGETDASRADALWALRGNPNKQDTLFAWIKANVNGDVMADEFLIDDEYFGLRKQAYAELIRTA
ncbi:MAG: hypothetical protein AAF850_03300 [Pseudomonadota bacterium]